MLRIAPGLERISRVPRFLLCSLVPLSLLVTGCGSEPPVAAGTAVPAPVDATPGDFQPAGCGKIVGTVTWTGPLPNVPPVIDIQPRPDGSGYDARTLPHPYAPRIDGPTYALSGAVVYLRDVNPGRARPWDLPPVRVEFRDSQIVVQQGAGAPNRVGFVRRGEPVTFQSCEPPFNVLRGRGAAFFAIPFPDPGTPLERSFDTYGRIALTSAAGLSWQAADLFVCDHPYYAVSAADGRFEFPQVPSGTYQLVTWHPNWNTTAGERNPETGLVQRVTYAPPLESARPVMVVPGRILFANANLSLPR